MSGRVMGALLRRNVLDAGRGELFGTTVEAGVPEMPVMRRVQLWRELGRPGRFHPARLVAETWSDSAGEWRFPFIDESGVYTVISYDHTEQYDPVIKVGQVPTPMDD